MQKAPPPNPIQKNSTWTARGRLDVKSVRFDVEGDDGCPAAYVDAKLVTKDGEVPTLTGTFKAEDGTEGTVEGCRVLRESRVGGIWHFEVQAGGDPMDHAFNAWLTAHPAVVDADGGSDANAALASHCLRVTGVVLAGPMVSEERPRVSGAYAALKRTLTFELQGGDGRWAGCAFEGEFAADLTLRGTWRHGDSSGRWLARHIGQRAVNASLRPHIEEGATWDAKRCTVKIGLEKSGRRPVSGDKVKLTKMYKFYDGEHNCLKPGQIGKLLEDDRTTVPFLVESPGGETDWYCEGAIRVVDSADETSATPLGDHVEGCALFSRFPAREGAWYAEVEVVKLGKSQPCVGWGVLMNNPKKVSRVMVVGGKTPVKLDIGEGAPKKEKKKKAKNDGVPLPARTVFLLDVPKVLAGEKYDELLVAIGKLAEPHGENEKLMPMGEGSDESAATTQGVVAVVYVSEEAADAAAKALDGAKLSEEEGGTVRAVRMEGLVKELGEASGTTWNALLEEKMGTAKGEEQAGDATKEGAGDEPSGEGGNTEAAGEGKTEAGEDAVAEQNGKDQDQKDTVRDKDTGAAEGKEGKVDADVKGEGDEGRGEDDEFGKDDAGACFECIAGPEVEKIGLVFSSMAPEDVVIKRIVPDTWADQKGIKAGDHVESVNGVSIHEMNLDVFKTEMTKRPLSVMVSRDF